MKFWLGAFCGYYWGDTLATIVDVCASDVSAPWTLCCGALARVDLLLAASDTLGDPGLGVTARVLAGRIVEGARRIIAAVHRVDDRAFHALDPFIYAESEYESRPADREFFDEEIRKEASRWATYGAEATWQRSTRAVEAHLRRVRNASK